MVGHAIRLDVEEAVVASARDRAELFKRGERVRDVDNGLVLLAARDEMEAGVDRWWRGDPGGRRRVGPLALGRDGVD